MLSEFVSSLWSVLKFNAATLSGCSDVIVIPDQNGNLKSTTFQVRFGKTKTLKPYNAIINIKVNNVLIPVEMILGHAGEAYFIIEEERVETELENLIESIYNVDDEYKLILNDSQPNGENKNTMPTNTSNLEELTNNEPQINENSELCAALSNKNSIVIHCSLCGFLLTGTPEFRELDNQLFNEHMLNWDDFNKNPSYWFDPALTFRIDIYGPIIPARVAYPAILSMLLFSRQISQESFITLLNSSLSFNCSNNVVDVELDNEIPHEATSLGCENNKLNINSYFNFCDQVDNLDNNEKSFPNKLQSNSVDFKKKYLSLKPTSKMLEKFNLKEGVNFVEYTVSSSLLGKRSIYGTIYLWSSTEKIIISDVDGTITKSDVWGQLMPIVGKDWSHEGVAKLFTTLDQRGYKIVYVTARAIGQADTTRDYLFGLTQDSVATLPDGPLFLSPDRLFRSFKREVIDREPILFKTAALNDIRSLFGPDKSPLFAGFGNKYSDYLAYTKADIAKHRIFIIDPKGNITHGTKNYGDSYNSVSLLIDQLFPQIPNTKSVIQSEELRKFKRLAYMRSRSKLVD